MTNPGSLTMGFAGVHPRQLAPSVGTAQVGNAILAASPASSTPADAITSPAPFDLTTQAESDLFGSLRFTAHLSTLRPIFADLRSGINLIFGAYRIYINHWGALRLTGDARAPTTTPAPMIDVDAPPAAPLRASP